MCAEGLLTLSRKAILLLASDRIDRPTPVEIAGSVALVTGASRGMGRAFVLELLERGADRVYATARHPEQIDVPGAEVLRLDVTDHATISAVAAQARDVTLLVNNAGINTYSDLTTGDLDLIHREMDTHVWGSLSVVRSFAPVLRSNGGGAILNVCSAMSWVSYKGSNAYAVAKAALWALTNGIRLELAEQGTLVTALHVGIVDTDMTAHVEIPKLQPEEVVRQALDGVAQRRLEVLADDFSAGIKAALARDPEFLYQTELHLERDRDL